MIRMMSALAMLGCLCQPVLVGGQAAANRADQVDAEIIWKIRREGIENSQIMRTMHFLTDIYGPRLTGSPNFKAAAEWSLKQMQQWGLTNAHLEPWDFGHPGWLNERFSAHIVAPVKDQLTCEVLAWTPGTNGAVTGAAYHMLPPERATKEQFAAYLEGLKNAVRGKIVLVGAHQAVPVAFNAPVKRRDEQEVRGIYDSGTSLNASPFGPAPTPTPTPPPSMLTAAQINEQLDAFLLANGALVRVNNAAREHGQIRAFANRTYDITKTVPTVVMRSEDYGRITRILAGNTPVELEFNIVNRTYPEGRVAYNVIAEIPGVDAGDEVVMLGGHLDSWHAATGATDNAIGCAVMMEAARILQAVKIKPRRTIRVALWSGEEQGLLGSKAYVAEHFGTFENPKPEFFKFGGYFNIDSGTGRARGALVFGPPDAADVLRRALSPFADLGVIGAVATGSRRAGGTDSTSFNEAGLPGIGLGQDPIEYGSHTWHTNLDTYERIIENDAQTSAIAVAAAVYHLAMRDELLPRFAKNKMPPPPPRPTPTPTPAPNSAPPSSTMER